MKTLITSKLEASRKELLDLGLRNPLINFTTRKNKIDIVDEKSVEIFRLLVSESKTMHFKAVPEKLLSDENSELNLLFEKEKTDWSQLFGEEETVEDNKVAARHLDLNLQTKLDSSSLLLRLLKLENITSSFIEEQGLNALYLALGFLHWFESDSSEKKRKAPIVLVPVKLERSSARERFKLIYTGDEIGNNLSLHEKLKTEFGIDIPPLDDEDIDLPEYFSEVKSIIKRKVKWEVAEDEIVLGFFSFGKLRMYNDLASESWPDNQKPSEHEIINALLHEGFNENPSELTDETLIDDLVKPVEQYLIMDADSSQTIAIEEVKRGKNLVIQGPPGTGKSQTITNLIAEAIGQNKKVLFVAEKMAALQVVKRRLDMVGLGDAVLELHSHKTNKKAVLEEIKRTLELNRPIKEEDSNFNSLENFREKLNKYSHAVNTPILESGVSPIAAIGNVIRIKKNHPEVHTYDFSPMESWNFSQYKSNRLRIEELQRRINNLGLPTDNQFWGSQLKVLLPQDEQKLSSKILDAEKLIIFLIDHNKSISRAFNVTPPHNPRLTKELIEILKVSIKAPKLTNIIPDSSLWNDNEEEIIQFVESCHTYKNIHSRYKDILADTIWEAYLDDIRKNIAIYGSKWWKFLSSKYRKSILLLRSYFRMELPKDYKKLLKIIDEVLTERKCKKILTDFEKVRNECLSVASNPNAVDWENVLTQTRWVCDFNKKFSSNNFSVDILGYITNKQIGKELVDKIYELEKELEQYIKSINDIYNFLQYEKKIDFYSNIDYSFEKEAKNISDFKETSRLRDLVRFNVLYEEYKSNNLNFVVDELLKNPQIKSSLLLSFDLSWFQGLLYHAFNTREELRQFDRESHEFTLNKFREIDKAIFEYNKARLAIYHYENLPDFIIGGGQISILKREMNKKRRHLPIRQLMIEAGNAIQAVKPIFMMGPLSIATYLPPGSLTFDLVVYDEASQIKPVDALGGILRAKQVVVVGDRQQLPPTNFFDKVTTDDDDDDEIHSISADMESILNLFVAQNAHEKMLRWHYRSRHDSLIAVSNYEFYNNRLVVFPSPSTSLDTKGLIFNHITDSFYDRGKSRSNQIEAKIVAERVMKHAKETPHLTLGVAAFSTAQRDAIQFQLELLRRQDDSCEHYFFNHQEEPFFIKNLENVQGDERDVIFISIGYGKIEGGYLSMNFGPLNKEGGERRLNVLISRAKRTCEVFANFSWEDIDLNRTNSRGVIALKHFLEFASTRRLLRPEMKSSSEAESIFEEEVIDALTKLGYLVVPQVGVSGFRIDIGVKDDKKSGRFLLGIECDGAKYHNSLSARDRDRLRQEVLENLGWKIHRIWSTEWFRNPEQEIRRVVESIEKAKVYWEGIDHGISVPDEPELSVSESSNHLVRREENKTDKEKFHLSIIPYKKSEFSIHLIGHELHQLPIGVLSPHVSKIIEEEGPLHKDILIQRVVELAGLSRTGRRINETLKKTLRYVLKDNKFTSINDFLLPRDCKIMVRDRSNTDANLRKSQYIPDLEFQQAVKLIVEKSFSISIHDAISQTYRILGITRLTQSTLDKGNNIVRKMITNNIFILDQFNNIEINS